jgi:hypothetical protein
MVVHVSSRNTVLLQNMELKSSGVATAKRIERTMHSRHSRLEQRSVVEDGNCPVDAGFHSLEVND